jgi:outer membrane protein assembly factor BamB
MTQGAKRLYLSDERSQIFALDKNSGSTVWKSEQLKLRVATAPQQVGKFLWLGDFQGYVQVLNREDGGLAARLATDGSSILTSPLALDGGVLVQTQNGGLYAVQVK